MDARSKKTHAKALLTQIVTQCPNVASVVGTSGIRGTSWDTFAVVVDARRAVDSWRSVSSKDTRKHAHDVSLSRMASVRAITSVSTSRRRVRRWQPPPPQWPYPLLPTHRRSMRSCPSGSYRLTSLIFNRSDALTWATWRGFRSRRRRILRQWWPRCLSRSGSDCCVCCDHSPTRRYPNDVGDIDA